MALRQDSLLDESFAACDRALTLNPNNAWAHYCGALSNLTQGRPTESLPAIETSLRLSPRTGQLAPRYWVQGFAHLMLEDYEAAITSIRKGVATNPRFPVQYWVLVSALGHLGRFEEAQQALAEFNRVDSNRRDTIAKVRVRYPYFPNFDHVLEGLRRAGMPEE